MKLFSRLFSRADDPRDALRPAWHRVVEIAREKRWYAEAGVADTVEGRFDMMTAVLCMVLLRMEQDEALVPASVHLTELFVEDMDGQLRERGVGDLMVGKHIGKLVSAMGGRLGAFREALAAEGNEALSAAVERNMDLLEGSDGTDAADALRAFATELEKKAPEAILAGGF